MIKITLQRYYASYDFSFLVDSSINENLIIYRTSFFKNKIFNNKIYKYIDIV